ncbi:NAD-dependent epimerase/dehydratase family protein [Mucilaginibacter xinganensis]|uniref:Epimerase n=1 Tax=Mucilaginibacter xinganensis TaxID=1234841 RepID=A0A223NTY2_9SPHI|nr:NAD(P)-dependent oxidoreductase [Mucilaginibacter xinganensis]ASU33098.1 epimerase [Mucilaginibacter xinganensis]
MRQENLARSIKILVTGATGKVGSKLVPRLIQWGYEVRALVRQTGRASFLKTAGAELAVGDLLNPGSFKAALKNVDVVIHLATFYKGANEEQSRKANIDGTEILAKASLEAGVQHFIFASSNRVYGSNRTKMVTETDATHSSDNQFAIAKVEVENLLLTVFEKSNPVLCILRFPLVYGDGDRHLKETIPALNDWPPAKRVQMVHHADLAQAVKLSISQKANGIYNVTDDAPLTISELRCIYHVPDTEDGQISDPWEMIVSNRKIRDTLGFRPIYPTFYAAHDAGAL